jgi:glycerophosphoryl diester phosphodiesterase
MDVIRIDSKNVRMVAHRGLSGLEKENTCPAFVAAGNRSYFGIETDVHTTRDGRFVIIHDETTQRVSNGESCVNVEEVDFADIENIVLPDVDGSRTRRDIRIPLLAEYIAICKKYGKVCVLELKNEFLTEDIVRLIDEIKALDYIGQVIFISFSWKNCVTVRRLLPENDVQWLTEDEVTAGMAEKLAANRLNLDMYYPRLTLDAVEMLHAKGIRINCWTCDDKEEAEKLVDMGVDYITSNIIE